MARLFPLILVMVWVFVGFLYNSSCGWDFQKPSTDGSRETELCWQIVFNFVVGTTNMLDQLRQECKVVKGQKNKINFFLYL